MKISYHNFLGGNF